MSSESTPSITVCPQGPLLLRGGVAITDDQGREIESREGPVALCRCGGSAIKPFCDGTHKLTKFEQRG